MQALSASAVLGVRALPARRVQQTRRCAAVKIVARSQPVSVRAEAKAVAAVAGESSSIAWLPACSCWVRNTNTQREF